MKFCTIPPFLSRISKLTRPDRYQVKTDSCRHPNRNRSFKWNFGLYVKMWLKARYPHIIPTQSIYKLSFAFVSKILNVFCVCRFSNFSLSFFLCCVCVFFQKFMILATVFSFRSKNFITTLPQPNLYAQHSAFISILVAFKWEINCMTLAKLRSEKDEINR